MTAPRPPRELTPPAQRLKDTTLTPIEDLLIALLAARHRLGEPNWPVRRLPAHTRALRRLAALGAVCYQHANIEGHWLAELTPAAQEAWIDPNYHPPALEEIDTLRTQVAALNTVLDARLARDTAAPQ